MRRARQNRVNRSELPSGTTCDDDSEDDVDDDGDNEMIIPKWRYKVTVTIKARLTNSSNE